MMDWVGFTRLNTLLKCLLVFAPNILEVIKEDKRFGHRLVAVAASMSIMISYGKQSPHAQMPITMTYLLATIDNL